MRIITIQSEQGEIRLRKSKRLAGLRLAASRSLAAPDYIRQEVFPQIAGFTLVELDTSEKALDEKLDEVRDLEEVELGTHVYYPEGSNRPLVPNGYIFFTFEDGVSEEEQAIVLDEFSLELVERRDPGVILAKVTAKSPNPIKTAALAQASCLVKIAQPDWDTILDEYDFSLPPDSLLGHQWHLQNNGFVPDATVQLVRGADARVINAWKLLGGMGDPSITIAVVDSGFDLSHPDFQGKIFRPFDLNNRSSALRQGEGTHGTPCASLALAGSNGTGMVGVAPHARFLPFNGLTFSDVETEFTFSYCMSNGADIISCSWGTTDTNFVLGSRKAAAIARAAREGRGGKGCVVVFAVGNEQLPNKVNIYATLPEVIAVAACTSNEQHAYYSNQGMEVTVCAPSDGDWPVLAARTFWDQGDQRKPGEYRYWLDGRSRGNAYKHFGGTSAATPIVAGVCALILSANPALTAREVKEILIQTADKIGPSWEYVGGHSRKFGYGRVNAEKAVAEALRRKGVGNSPMGTSPSPGPSPTSGTTPGGGNLQVPKSGWGVQAAAFSVYAHAAPLAARLKTQFGQPVYICESRASGRLLYVIMVGVFVNIQQATTLQGQMQQRGVNGFVKNFADLR